MLALGQGVAAADVQAPHSIIAFPQRDFISASGYAASDRVKVEVVHPGGVTWTAVDAAGTNQLQPQDDPRTDAFDGVVEVNHPGGACWAVKTPDIRPGDTVRLTTTSATSAVPTVETTVVANVTAKRPVQSPTDPTRVTVSGTGADGGGAPLAVATLEQRLVAGRDAFDLNGRRTLRATSVAGNDGQLAATPDGSINWTATYGPLSSADVTRALAAESRGMWINPAVPAGAVDSTIYENGAGIVPGPAAPCTAPLEKLIVPGAETEAPTTPAGLGAVVTNNNTVTLNWTGSTDNVGVVDYGVYRDGVAIATVQNTDASAPAPTTFVDKNVAPGTYTYTVDAGDAAGNRSLKSNGAPATTVANPAPAVTPNEPPTLPVSIISFPSRDFVSPAGFLPTDTVDISLIRDGKVISTADGQVPQDDDRTPGFDGLVEVNHPGGGCWAGVTPEIRPGDVIRTVAWNGGTIRTIDQTRTANVTATKPAIVTRATSATSRDGAVEIHGTAYGANGKPLPLDQIEQRLVANRDLFDTTGKRTLRAPGNGDMSYDTANNPTGGNWTATYSGLTADDVARAVGGTSLTGRTFSGAESRILWLGVNPLSGQELTIFENGLADPPGPVAAFCDAPLETPDAGAPSVPTGFTADQSGPNSVALNWTPSTDNWSVSGYRILRDGKALANVGGSFANAADSTSTFSVPTTFTDTGVAPGSHTYAVAAYDNASPLGPGTTAVEKVGAGIGQPYGNVSDPSTSVTLTQGDVTAPSIPANVVAKTTGQNVTLTWSPSTDDVGVSEYGVYRRAVGSTTWVKQGTVAGGAAALTLTDTAVPSGSYEYAVDAADAAANRSAKSDPPATATVAATADTTAPDPVTGLAATNDPDIHGKNVKVTWNAGTDNVGVTGYGVYRDGTKIADINAPALAFTDLNRPAGTYQYTVDAVDSAGNRSATKPAAVTVVVANDPPVAPHDVIAFPARDFISATGYTPGTAYTFSVVRGTKTIATSTAITADATGLAEVNHPGGACWNTVTPNIQPGDVVRITDPKGVAEQTTVPGVTAERPMVTAVDSVTGGGTIEVHGTAQDAAGQQIPIDQLEQRLVANRDAFDFNGRRTLRAGAGSDGTIAYDSATSKRWTATYVVQTPNDLARAVGGTSTSGTQFAGAESRILWNGRTPAALNEQTIYENGPGVVGGPAAIAGCTSGAAETPAPGAALSAAPTFAPVASGSTGPAQQVTLTNNGTAPLRFDRAYLAGLNPGDFTITTDTASGTAVPVGGIVRVSVAFKPTAAGTRQANLSFADDAANTTDQSVTLTASTPVATTPTATAPVQSLAAGQKIQVKAPLNTSTIDVDLRWTGTGSRFEVQMASGNGAVVGKMGPLPLPVADTATSTKQPLSIGGLTGTAYQFQVRSCTGTTCGAWAVGPKFTLMAVDEPDTGPFATVFKGTWATLALPGAYGGTVKTSSTSAVATIVPAVSFTVSGNAAWVSTRGPDMGQAQVQVDGQTPQVVDLYTPDPAQPATVVWARDALPPGTHTVTVTVLGKKSPSNPAACNTGTKCARVDIDGAVMIK